MRGGTLGTTGRLFHAHPGHPGHGSSCQEGAGVHSDGMNRTERDLNSPFDKPCRGGLGGGGELHLNQPRPSRKDEETVPGGLQEGNMEGTWKPGKKKRYDDVGASRQELWFRKNLSSFYSELSLVPL